MDKRLVGLCFMATTLPNYVSFSIIKLLKQTFIIGMQILSVSLLINSESGWLTLGMGALERLRVHMETSFLPPLLVSVILHNRFILWSKFAGITLDQLINSIINFCSTSAPTTNWFKPTAVYPLCFPYIPGSWDSHSCYFTFHCSCMILEDRNCTLLVYHLGSKMPCPW